MTEKEIERAYLARKAFEILLKNKLKTSSLEEFCLKNNIKLDELIKEIMKYRKGELESKPSEKELAKYHYLAMQQDRKLLAKTCQVLYQKLIRNGMQTESLEALALKFGLGSGPTARIYANRYAYREFEDIGFAPTKEELELEEKAHHEKSEEQKEKNNELAKKVIEMVLSTKEYKESIAYYANITELSENTIKKYIRSFLKEGTLPKDKIEQFLAIRNKANASFHDRMPIALKAKDVFEYFKGKDYDFSDCKELEEKYDVKRKQLLVLFNQYINGEFAYLGVLPSEEDVASYNNAIKRKEEDKSQKRIKIGKMAYEILIENGHNLEGLKPLCEENKIAYGTLLVYISNYRKRVVAPKPTQEQEKLYISGYKELKKANNKKDPNEIIQIIIEFITSSNYFLEQTLKKYGYQKQQVFTKLVNNSQNPTVIALYEEALQIEKERQEEFHLYLHEIIKAGDGKVNLLDLQLTFKMPLEDIKDAIRHLAKEKIIKNSSAETIIKEAGFGYVTRIHSIEELDKFSSNYKGRELDLDTKKRIYNYLLEQGVKDINDRIIITYFQRYVNNQLSLPITFE